MKNNKLITGIAIMFIVPCMAKSQTKNDVISKTEKVKVTGGREVFKQYLTENEKKEPIAKYFYMPMAKPKQALVDSVNKGPLDPGRALPFDRLNDLLKPGFLASEIGYCTLADGTGYVSSIVEMPGVTPKMFDWWFTWHQLEPLRYKIWDHYVHYDVEINEAARKKLVSSNIPVHEKNWNVTHHATEDIGVGSATIVINFVSPKDFGFDMSKFKEPNVGTAICAIGGSKMVHIARRTKGGMELRTRFWFPAQAKIPVALLRGLNLHALEEYSNLSEILPLLYREYGPKK